MYASARTCFGNKSEPVIISVDCTSHLTVYIIIFPFIDSTRLTLIRVPMSDSLSLSVEHKFLEYSGGICGQ